MNFIFICPVYNKVFESPNFRIIEDNGIVTDENGNRTLDAKVSLQDPCPFCGQLHVYHASELSCPFDGGPQSS